MGDKITPAGRYENAKVIDENKNVLSMTILDFLKDIGCEETTFNSIKTKEEVLNYIIRFCKAKRFVAAGVGGLLINNEADEVLLYLRPKEPEKYKWSMPGGSIEFGEDATKALINEYKYITGIDLKAGDLLPLRITNHKDDNRPCRYHYLSPAFTVKRTERFLDEIEKKISRSQQKIKEDFTLLAHNIMPDADEQQITDLIEDIKSGHFFLKDWEPGLKMRLPEQKYQKYIVKWFSVNDIKDSERLSEPTKRALKSYLQRASTINNIAKETGEILQKATEDAQKKVISINIESIIETDD